MSPTPVPPPADPDAAVAVHNLLFRYAEAIDAGDFEGIAELLAHARIGGEDGEAVVLGRAGVLAMFTGSTRRYPDGTPGTRHVTSNVILEAGPDGTVDARSTYTVLQAVAGLPLQPIVSGRYRDRFERIDGAWRFAERRFALDLVGDVSHHLLTPVPGRRPRS